MCREQHHGPRCLVDLAALDADQPVLDDVEPTDPLCATPGVELLDRLEHRHVLAVDRDRHAVLERDHDLVGVAWLRRVVGVGVDVLDRGVPDVLEEPRLHRAAPDVLVDGVRRLLGHVDRQLVLVGILDRLLAGPGVVAHRCDHGQVRRERADSDLEPHLVVALARCSRG